MLLMNMIYNLLLLYASNLMIRVITLRSQCYMYYTNLDWSMQMIRAMTFRYELICCDIMSYHLE